MNMREIVMDDFPAVWEAWHCLAPCCAQAQVHARRRPGTENLWLLYERPGWLIAASAPMCPGCGATLARATRQP
jgi:hypothetical protein